MRFPDATVHTCWALGSHSTAASSDTPINKVHLGKDHLRLPQKHEN